MSIAGDKQQMSRNVRYGVLQQKVADACFTRAVIKRNLLFKHVHRLCIRITLKITNTTFQFMLLSLCSDGGTKSCQLELVITKCNLLTGLHFGCNVTHSDNKGFHTTTSSSLTVDRKGEEKAKRFNWHHFH